MSTSDDPAPIQPGLGRIATRGGAVMMVGQLVRIVIQFAGIIVLGRLLSPSDFGLLAMVVAIVGVGEVFRDFGLSSAAVQATLLSKAQRANLFWINSGIGVALAIITVALSGPIALFYDDSRLAPMAQILALTFILNGVSTQYRADLNRALRFKALATVDILGPLVGLIVGVVMALTGFEYWALVGQQVAVPLASLIALLVLCRWAPGLPNREGKMGPLLKFGGNLVGVQLLTYASKNVDSIIIGSTLGSATLGLYDRAFQILMLPLNQINAPATRVALPVLSRLQNESDRFRAFVLQGQSIMTHAVTFVLAFAIAQAAPLFLLVLGPQWGPSAIIFQLLAVGGIAQVVSYATYWVFLAKGLTASNLRYALITRPLLIAGILVGSLWGVYGIAIAYSAALVIFWPFGLWWIGRVSNAPAWGMFINGGLTIVGYAVCGVGSYFASQLVPEGQTVLRLVVGAAAFLAVFALVNLVWPAFRRGVLEIVRLARHAKVLRPGT